MTSSQPNFVFRFRRINPAQIWIDYPDGGCEVITIPSPRHLEYLRRRFIEGLSHHEAAEAMCLDSKSAYRLSREVSRQLQVPSDLVLAARKAFLLGLISFDTDQCAVA